MPCKINLRHDQTQADFAGSQEDGVRIFAANWVQKALTKLAEKLQGTAFEFQLVKNNISELMNFMLTDNISLAQLQMITRLEPINVTGVIAMDYYEPDISDKSIIFALRDLVRQCVIVGIDETTHYGGYCTTRRPQEAIVYVVDLAALQFQKIYNSGRLVIIPETPDAIPIGFLDDIIFEQVVGEPKKKFEDVDPGDSNFVNTKFFGHSCYFDTFAYRHFVSQDVIVSGIALNTMAKENGHKNIHFKFLKYGTGYFSGSFRGLLDHHILRAVIDGLEALFGKYLTSTDNVIKHVEFPFFTRKESDTERLDEVKSKFGVTYSFSTDDALKVEVDGPSLRSGTTPIFATTNCADPHAAFGNEMGFNSVDGAIASNLKSKGNIFCPCLNRKIKSQFIDL